MRDTLMKLLAAYGASGRENTVANVIADMVKPYCDRITTDALGSLICEKFGPGKRVMLAAHMDHIAFIVTDIDEKGFLRVHNAGGVPASTSVNRHVAFENGVQGLVALEEEDDPKARPTMRSLYIDIGAASREEAEKLVRIGDAAVYAPDTFALSGNRISAPAMDNRAGCAVLVKLIQEIANCPHHLICAFTAQEEVGLRGARAAAYAADPEVGLAFDVTACGDAPEEKGLNMKLGGGAAIKIMDASLIAHPGVVRKLEEAAQRCGAKHQREVLPYGGTDAGAMQITRGGVPAGVISIPCRYVHSAVETVDLSDMEAALALSKEYLMGESLY